MTSFIESVMMSLEEKRYNEKKRLDQKANGTADHIVNIVLQKIDNKEYDDWGHEISVDIPISNLRALYGLESLIQKKVSELLDYEHISIFALTEEKIRVKVNVCV